MNIVRLRGCHSKIGNSPRIIAIPGEVAPGGARIFYGVGPPSGSTLVAGDSGYNGYDTGYIADAQLAVAGSGYSVGDEIMENGIGSLYATRFIVESVLAGQIVDFHVSKTGVYAPVGPYPTNPVATTAVTGAGTGAKFNLNFSNPDLYVDVTTPTAPVLYICTVGGTSGSSTWAIISGGGGGVERFRIRTGGMHDNYMICETWDGTTGGGVDIAIAKAPNVRHVGSSNVEGTTVTYGYFSRSGNIDGKRTASAGGSSEDQIVIPVWNEGDDIFAVKPLRGTGVGSAPIYMDNDDSRMWAAI